MWSASRDDKRYTEKKNKSERARRKKEDTARLRNIVDLTLRFVGICVSTVTCLLKRSAFNSGHCSLDPRIKRIKQEEKEAREAKKAAKSAPATGANTPTGKSKAEEEAEKKQKEEEEQVRILIVSIIDAFLACHRVLMLTVLLSHRLPKRRSRNKRLLLPRRRSWPGDSREWRRERHRTHRMSSLSLVFHAPKSLIAVTLWFTRISCGSMTCFSL